MPESEFQRMKVQVSRPWRQTGAGDRFDFHVMRSGTPHASARTAKVDGKEGLIDGEPTAGVRLNFGSQEVRSRSASRFHHR